MYPFQYIMDTIRGWFRSKLSRNFRLEIDTLQTIQLLAAQEKKTPEEIADAILVGVFLDHQAQEENFRRWQTLTRREKEVVALICLGYNTREIADKLTIAQPTVKTHVTHILGKFGVQDRNSLRVILNGWEFKE